jgi:hypothetical protein
MAPPAADFDSGSVGSRVVAAKANEGSDAVAPQC